MAITKQKKVDVVAKLGNALAEAVSVVFVRFHKLSVADTTKMRKALRAEGIGFYVAKKTLLNIALEKKGYVGQVPELPGEIAIAWGAGDDATGESRRGARARRPDGAGRAIRRIV